MRLLMRACILEANINVAIKFNKRFSRGSRKNRQVGLFRSKSAERKFKI